MKGGGLLPAHGDGERIKVSIRERWDDGIMGLLNLKNGRESNPTLKWPPIFQFRCDVFLFDDEHIIYLTRCFFSQ